MTTELRLLTYAHESAPHPSWFFLYGSPSMGAKPPLGLRGYVGLCLSVLLAPAVHFFQSPVLDKIACSFHSARFVD